MRPALVTWAAALCCQDQRCGDSVRIQSCERRQESGVSSCQDDSYDDHHADPHHIPGAECAGRPGDWRPAQPEHGHVQQDPLLHGHLTRGQEGVHQPLGHTRGQGEARS